MDDKVRGPFYCEVCDCELKDSANFQDHINGKRHNRKKGIDLKDFQDSTLDEVQEMLNKKIQEKRERQEEKTCLGDNPYMRMMVDRHGQECKVCNRPFVTYRWCPGKKMRYKKTEICRICSKAKNVCQTCLLDLKYNLPVQARDSLLKVSNDIPRSDVNREYHAQILEQKYGADQEAGGGDTGQLAALASSGDSGAPPLAIAGTSSAAAAAASSATVCASTSISSASAESNNGKELSAGARSLAKLARRTPYYKRNLPHICSFWVKGECKRGAECPYRHEKPTDPEDPLSKQNIKDRYHGTRDPVAQKLLARAAQEERSERGAKEPTEFVE